MKLLLIAVGFCAVSLSFAAEGSFNYKDFNAWGGVCNTGKKQSPINIQRRRALDRYVNPFVFVNYDDKFHYEINNNGHTVQLKMDQSCAAGITGGDLRGYYVLDNIHFHWRSEHTFEGKRYALEAHFVHYKKDYKNTSEASKHKDGLAVLGVLFKESDYASSNEALDQILPYFGNYSEGSVTPADHLAPGSLLPKDQTTFYRYAGSLTTPPCSESVTWTVFRELLPISTEQVTALYNVRFNKDKENFRATHDYHGRKLFFLSDFDNSLSCSRKTHAASILCLLMSLSRIFPRGYHQTFH